jgi:hypothetical protein
MVTLITAIVATIAIILQTKVIHHLVIAILYREANNGRGN